MSSKSSTEPPGPEPVLVGRVRRPHGVRGAVIVESLTDIPDRWEPGSRLLDAADTRRELEVERSQEHSGSLLVWFRGVDDRDAAGALRGVDLAVREEDVPPPEEGTWYQFQLVGCRCRDAEAGDLGEVVDLVEDGGGDLLLIDDGHRRLLVPFVRAFLDRVDMEAREIDLRLPPGLIETCASGS